MLCSNGKCQGNTHREACDASLTAAVGRQATGHPTKRAHWKTYEQIRGGGREDLAGGSFCRLQSRSLVHQSLSRVNEEYLLTGMNHERHFHLWTMRQITTISTSNYSATALNSNDNRYLYPPGSMSTFHDVQTQEMAAAFPLLFLSWSSFANLRPFAIGGFVK